LQLQSAYQTRNYEKLLFFLHYRSKFVFDEDIVDAKDPTFCFMTNKSNLDFFMIVGDQLGLHISFPTLTFTVMLNLKLPIKEFQAKYGTLRFNPAGCMLYIGSTSAKDLWHLTHISMISINSTSLQDR
jgi:hypothetical protein